VWIATDVHMKQSREAAIRLDKKARERHDRYIHACKTWNAPVVIGHQ
jgi:hypothetical protein